MGVVGTHAHPRPIPTDQPAGVMFKAASSYIHAEEVRHCVMSSRDLDIIRFAW